MRKGRITRPIVEPATGLVSHISKSFIDPINIDCFSSQARVFEALLDECVKNGIGNSLIVQSHDRRTGHSFVRRVIESNAHLSPVWLWGALMLDIGQALRMLSCQLSSHLGETIKLSTFDELALVLEDRPAHIIFILDEFEKFSKHAQQSMLYSLFELCHSHRVVVVGLSCRCEVMELLEKRVKSRFSQNIIYLPHIKVSDAISNHFEESDLSAPPPIIKEILASNDNQYQPITVDSVVNEMYMAALYAATNPAGTVEPNAIQKICHSPDKLPALGLPSLCVLVALRRARMKAPGMTVNFESLCKEYYQIMALADKNDLGCLSKRYSKPTIRMALEQLESEGLVFIDNSTDLDYCFRPIRPRIQLTCLLDYLNDDCPEQIVKMAKETF